MGLDFKQVIIINENGGTENIFHLPASTDVLGEIHNLSTVHQVVTSLRRLTRSLTGAGAYEFEKNQQLSGNLPSEMFRVKRAP